MSTRGQGPDVDAPLRAALDHAPDHDLRPPAAVRAAVLRAAHAAVPAQPAQPAAWRRWLGLGQGWGSRGLWTAVASVASLGLALNLAWHVSTTPEGADDSASADMRPAPAPAPAAAPVAPAPTAKVAEAAPAAAPVRPSPSPAAREERGRLDKLSQAPERAMAPPSAEKPRAAAAPSIEATSVDAPPPPAPAPAMAEAAAPAPRAPGTAIDRRADLSVLPAKKGLADAAPMALGQAVASPWPEPLARLSPVLAADADWPAAGWQVKALSGAAAIPPKAWWRALLQASAGRWQAEPGPLPADAAAAPAWQVSASDGSRFTLTLAGGAAWLQAGGATWRAASVPPLP